MLYGSLTLLAVLDIIDTKVDSINITRAYADLEEDPALHTCRSFCNCGILFPSLLVTIHAVAIISLFRNKIARNYNTAFTEPK
jgi:hypothetical protein